MLPAPKNGARAAGCCNSPHLQFFGKGSVLAPRGLRGAARPRRSREQLPKKLFPAGMIPEMPPHPKTSRNFRATGLFPHPRDPSGNFLPDPNEKSPNSGGRDQYFPSPKKAVSVFNPCGNSSSFGAWDGLGGKDKNHLIPALPRAGEPSSIPGYSSLAWDSSRDGAAPQEPNLWKVPEPRWEKPQIPEESSRQERFPAGTGRSGMGQGMAPGVPRENFPFYPS